MKTLIMSLALITFFTFPSQMISQRTQPSEKKVNTERTQIQKSIIREPNNNENTRPSTIIRDPNKKDINQKVIKYRQPRKTQNEKNKKTPIVEDQTYIYVYEEILIEEYIYPPTPIYDRITDSDNKFKISEYPYPDFPLRFVNASIDYQYTYHNRDIYELSFIVKATYNNFFNQFGILLTNDQELEKVIFFNDEMDFLIQGKNYLFKKSIKLKTNGYVNIRLGYYDKESNIFYPEELLTNKTDKLIFIEKSNEVYLN